MVKLSSTCSWINNSSGIGLEDWLIGFNSNGHWLLGNGSSELWRAVCGNIFVWENTNGSLRFNEGAGTILSGVGIVSFSLKFGSLSILECSIKHSTVTTFISEGRWAINKLLLWKGDHLSSFYGIHALNGTSGREWPAWSALALVLNGGNSNVSPVNLFGNRNISKDLRGLVGSKMAGFESEHVLVFLGSHVRKFVNSHSEFSFSVHVVSHDGMVVLGENSKSVRVFLFGSISFVVFGNEGLERSLLFGDRGSNEALTVN